MYVEKSISTGNGLEPELLVQAGELRAGEQSYDRDSWVRLPAGEYPEFVAATGGVTLYLKTGHLSGTTGMV